MVLLFYYIKIMSNIEQEVKESNLLHNTLTQPWQELETSDFDGVFGFSVKNNTVGVLTYKHSTKRICVCLFKGQGKYQFIELNNNRELVEKLEFLVTPYSDKSDAIYLENLIPFASFLTTGYTKYYGYEYPKIEAFRFREGIILDTIELVEPHSCKRLLRLETDLELVVVACRPLEFRGKTRYILKFEIQQWFFLSNYWLEQEIKDKQIDLNNSFRIRLGELKTTPTKNQ